jgi:UV DNA damage endonuclease
MKLRHIGYACINVQIDLTTNRTFRLAKLSEEQARQTAAVNFAALQEILKWNVQHGIRLFRVGSSIIPFASHEQFTLDWSSAFAGEIASIRQYVKDNGLRLSMHPGQYTVLNSPNPKTLADSVREIEWQTRLVSLLDPEQGVAVLHVGGAYGDKVKAIDRFADHFYSYLSDNARSRLVVENDDVTFNLDDVLSLHDMTGSPIIFDILHHKANHVGNDWTERLLPKLERVVASWRGKVPKVHLSSPKAGSKTTHADYIEQPDFEELLYWMDQLNNKGPFDVMIEAKLKDKAVQALSCELFTPPEMVAAAGSGS